MVGYWFMGLRTSEISDGAVRGLAFTHGVEEGNAVTQAVQIVGFAARNGCSLYSTDRLKSNRQ